MMASSLKTEDTDKVSSSGMMEESMREVGKMGNNMGLECIGMDKAKNRKENGKTERESDGCHEIIIYRDNDINILDILHI
jgi:hypothetical protein